MNKRIEKYQIFLENNKKELQQEEKIKVEPEIDEITETVKKHEESMLNFYLSKQILIKFDSSDENQLYKALFIIREIRCRLTKRTYSSSRQANLYSVLFYDLFGIERSSPFNIVEKLLKEPKTVSETLKLLNVVANERVGRGYLGKATNLIRRLVQLLYKDEEDTYDRQNCLSIIQKFSLKPEAQTVILGLDVVNWIVSVFVSVLV